ncbi:EfeM/EfeO family lipoprotein [Orbus mooreae]|uniref:EfeM/EfeO family lipoprotein n=1 Tax=Orbus mooreae TaxID=3074107 RepID=UPI00370D91B5
MRSIITIFLSLTLLGITYNVTFAKALRSPVQTGENIIIAKGDIPTPEKYQPAIESYLEFVSEQVNKMVIQLEILQQSIQNGDLKQAQDAYVLAHQDYERIRPIVILFGNTDRTINARADYFLDQENDYRFVGFHLVEYQLFKLKNLKDAQASSNELLMKARDLQKRLQVETIEIPKLVQSSADFIEMILETKLAGKENIYSRSDIADIAANIQGSEEIVKVLTPFITTETLENIKSNFAKINEIINSYQLDNNKYQVYDQLNSNDKNVLYSLLTQQAELLATLRAQINVDVYYKY